jgi:VIT1/CCC1 family predicted Fe2+/Mn2+ transporter
MVELYTNKGLSLEDAEKVVSIYCRNPKFFVDVMMKEELELMPPDSRNPIVNALFIWLSTSVAGLIPLLPFVFSATPSTTEQQFSSSAVSLSYGITVLSLFICGSMRVSGVSRRKSSKEARKCWL